MSFQVIYSSKLFDVVIPDTPHVDRNDGGQIDIWPKRKISDRTKLTSEEAKELMKLSMVFGEAMLIVLRKNGVDIDKVNYQENGNWSNVMHLHLYGRAKSSKHQKFGEALNFPKPETGFYDKNRILTDSDIRGIKLEAEKLLKSDKYSNF